MNLFEYLGLAALVVMSVTAVYFWSVLFYDIWSRR